MKRFPWEDKLSKEGVSIFDEKTITNFVRIRDKYKRDYIPFLDALVRRVGKKYSDSAKELRVSVQGVISDIDVLATGKIPADGVEGLADRLHDNMGSIDRAFKFYRDEIEKNEALRKRFEATEKKTEVSFNELETAHTKIERAMTEDLKPERKGFLEQLEKTSPKTYELGKGLLTGMTEALFGPLTGAGATVFETGGDIYKSIREHQLEKKRKELATTLTPMAKEMRQPELEKVARKRRVGEPLEEATLGGVAKTSLGGPVAAMEHAAREESLATEVRARVDRRPSGETSVRGSAGSSTEALFQFFNKRAYEARWTNDVLDALKKIRKETPTGSVGGFGLLPSGLLPGLLSALGVAGSAAGAGILGVIANKMDKILHDKNPDFAKKIDLFKFGGLPGMNLVNPIQGPKMMADAYADLTKRVMASLEKPLSEFAVSLDRLSTSVTSLAEGPFKKIGDFFGGMFKGKAPDISKSDEGAVSKQGRIVETPKVVVPVKNHKVEPVSSKPQVLKVDTEKAKPSESRLEQMFARFNENMERLLSKMDQRPTSSPGVSQTMSRGTTEDARGTGDSALDALNYGSLGIYDR